MFKTQGLIDIQVNGFAGVDFNNASQMTAETLDHALEAMLASGVTTCLPTLITASPSELEARFIALDNAIQASRLGKLMIPGFHLEGPFLNAQEGYAGCHPKKNMCLPDIRLIEHLEKMLSRPILIITYAPEFDENQTFTKHITAMGKVASVGHSNADHSVIEAAAKAGLRLSTHLGNGLPQTLHKFNNTLFAQLGCDHLIASLIADGIHIPPFVLKTLLRSKGIKQTILVTDAVSAAACSKVGIYQFAGFEIERMSDGTVRVPESAYLAGSSLTLDQAVRNLIQWELADFNTAIMMASQNPMNLLQNTFKYHQVTLPTSTVIWDEHYEVTACSIGNVKRNYPAKFVDEKSAAQSLNNSHF